MSQYKDPTTIRLSDNFLLSDFMYCDSVVRYGYANVFDTDDNQKLKQARKLAETLDTLIAEIAPLRISYGFISPELSRNIVKYQSPDKPSYHRFDIGAAVDIRFPGIIEDHLVPGGLTPIEIAWNIEKLSSATLIEYSRMITYSESEWICFATNCEEKEQRRAFYENRFIEGDKKPKFITYPQKNRDIFIEKQEIPINWAGQGWPRYHGGGRRQFQHCPVSKYTTRLDFLYNKRKVRDGIKNLPPLTNRILMARWSKCAEMAGLVIDSITDTYSCHVSIIESYNSSDPESFKDKFTLTIVPPTFLDIEDTANFLLTQKDIVDTIEVVGNTIKIVSNYIE